MTRTVEVAGAGFAGLVAAIELARRGWRVTVHEQAARPRAFGAGIFLWENGLRVLAELGAADEVLSRSHAAEQWEERDARDNLLGIRALPLPGGLRMVTMTRQHLYSVLLAHAREAGVRLRTASRVTGARSDGVLETAYGGAVRADLVIGADGIRSPVRRSLELRTEHEVFPFGLFRFLVPLDRAPGVDGKWRNYLNYWNLEQRRRVLYVPCNDEDLYLLLGATDTDEALTPPLDPGLWTSSFSSLRPVLRQLPAAARFDRYEVLRLECWSAGRVAIVGDSAHAMPPTIGQGAGTAMLNALNLARTVDDSHDVTTALRAWEAANRPMTEQTQRESVAVVRDLFPDGGARRDSWTGDVLAVARNTPKH